MQTKCQFAEEETKIPSQSISYLGKKLGRIYSLQEMKKKNPEIIPEYDPYDDFMFKIEKRHGNWM